MQIGLSCLSLGGTFPVLHEDARNCDHHCDRFSSDSFGFDILDEDRSAKPVADEFGGDAQQDALSDGQSTRVRNHDDDDLIPSIPEQDRLQYADVRGHCPGEDAWEWFSDQHFLFTVLTGCGVRFTCLLAGPSTTSLSCSL
jgi:hypothetical protein